MRTIQTIVTIIVIIVRIVVVILVVMLMQRNNSSSNNINGNTFINTSNINIPKPLKMFLEDLRVAPKPAQNGVRIAFRESAVIIGVDEDIGETLNPKPQPQTPKSKPPSPKPLTLNPKPPSPKPLTRNPQPLTLNPKPQTSNPKP